VGDKGAATAVAAKKSVRTDKRRIVSVGLDMQLTRIIEETLRLDEEGKKEKKKRRGLLYLMSCPFACHLVKENQVREILCMLHEEPSASSRLGSISTRVGSLASYPWRNMSCPRPA
jgi:hypothetical protein